MTTSTVSAAHASFFATAIADLSNIVHILVHASGLDPASKASVTDTVQQIRTDAVSVAADAAKTGETVLASAPAELDTLATEGVESVGSLGGPMGELTSEVVAPAVGAEAGAMLSNIMTVLETHNKSLMTDLASLASKA